MFEVAIRITPHEHWLHSLFNRVGHALGALVVTLGMGPEQLAPAAPVLPPIPPSPAYRPEAAAPQASYAVPLSPDLATMVLSGPPGAQGRRAHAGLNYAFRCEHIRRAV